MMNEDMNDNRISEIYHGGQPPTPPPETDDAILHAARRAVAKDDRSARRGAASPFGGRLAPFSVAAVVLLAVLVVPVLLQQEQAPRTPLEESPAGDPGAAEPRRDTGPVMTDPVQNNGILQPAPTPAGAPRAAAVQKAPAVKAAESRSDSARGTFQQEADAPLLHPRGISIPAEMRQYGSAEDWMARIEQLAAQREIAAARRELDRFIDVYPDYAIEPALLESLGLPLRPTTQP